MRIATCQCMTACTIAAIGLGFGLMLPDTAADEHNTRVGRALTRLSDVLGWSYFAMWSASFYPQVYSNYVRQSVVGLSFDFELYNLIGFSCYAIFNCAFFFDAAIQQQYMAANEGNRNLVRANDVFFALHALLLTLVTIAQCFVYDRGTQKLSRTASVAASMAAVLTLAASWMAQRATISTLNWLYWLADMKLATSLVKYVPQMMLNHRRRSTTGWNIYNVLLDLGGGVLSIAQLILDASLSDNWIGITGDPVKLGLGISSLVFDAIFMLQHYVWYAKPSQSAVSHAVGVVSTDSASKNGGSNAAAVVGVGVKRAVADVHVHVSSDVETHI